MSLDNIGRQANLINLVTDEFLGVGKLWLLLCHTTISEATTNTSRSTITLVNVNASVVSLCNDDYVTITSLMTSCRWIILDDKQI